MRIRLRKFYCIIYCIFYPNFTDLQNTYITTFNIFFLKDTQIDMYKYRVIYKSLREFRRVRYSRRDGHAEGEHVNRGRNTPSFCPTLQVLDVSNLGDAADVNLVIKFLPHTCKLCGKNLITGLTSAALPKVDISSTCKVGQKIGVSVPLLTCYLSV